MECLYWRFHGSTVQILYSKKIENFHSPVQWKEMEREAMEEENRKILEFCKQQEEREKARMAARKEQAESMDAVRSQLAGEIEEKRAQQEEMER